MHVVTFIYKQLNLEIFETPLTWTNADASRENAFSFIGEFSVANQLSALTTKHEHPTKHFHAPTLLFCNAGKPCLHLFLDSLAVIYQTGVKVILPWVPRVIHETCVYLANSSVGVKRALMNVAAGLKYLSLPRLELLCLSVSQNKTKRIKSGALAAWKVRLRGIGNSTSAPTLVQINKLQLMFKDLNETSVI